MNRKATYIIVATACLAIAGGIYYFSRSSNEQLTIDWNSPLPTDTNTRIGHLDNGLTYYIRRNTEPKQRADFYIAQNVGSILEDDNQDGLAHFLEHMAFNGTKNFPGKLLLNYFESIGVKFGDNINAYTAADQTVYNLSDVPTTRTGIIDSAILALHDWSGFILLEGQEIESERGVIREEWRSGQTADQRMSNKLMPIIFNNSKYAERDIIGNIDIINNFEHQTIRDFYHKWYRPDLQAIIIVGDIDVDQIEQRIKSIFSDIPKHQNPTPRPSFYIDDNEEPLVGVATDPEAKNIVISVGIRNNATPPQNKNHAYLKSKVYDDLIVGMLSYRIDDIIQSQNAPFINCEIIVDNLVRTQTALFLDATAKKGNVEDGVKSLIREVMRAKNHGFSQTEIDLAVESYMGYIENTLLEKNSKKNGSYVTECVNHFLSNEPLIDTQYSYEVVKNVLQNVTADEVNRHAKRIITDKNTFVAVTGPATQGVVPTVEQITKAVAEVRGEMLEAYVDKVSDSPLIQKMPTPGSVVTMSEDKTLGTKEWTLSNGARVVFKTTDFNNTTIFFEAYSRGGLSLAETRILPSAHQAAQLVINGGLADFSSTDLSKKIAGKVVQVKPFIEEDMEGVEGSSSTKDFETMLQLIYLTFTNPRNDSNTNKAYMDRMKQVYANEAADPNTALRDTINAVMSSHSPRFVSTNAKTLGQVDTEEAMKFYKERFADASNFTFIFVGNINPQQVKPMIEQYIGGLPTLNRQEKEVDNGIRTPKGKVVNHFKKPITTPKSTVFIDYSGNVEYNLKNQVLTAMLASVLQITLIEEIREKEGASYNVDAQGSLYSYPVQTCELQISFDTDPAVMQKMVGIAHRQVKDIATKGFPKQHLSKAKEYLLKAHAQNLRNNQFWVAAIREKYKNGIDISTTYSEVVNGITPEQVVDFANKLLEQNNVVEVSMSPSK